MKNWLTYNFKSKTIIVLIFFVFFIEPVATLIIHYTQFSSLRLMGYYKIALFLIVIVLCDFKKLSKKNLVLLSFLLIIYVTNQIINPIIKETIEFQISKGSLYYGFRFLYIFIIILCLNTIKSKNKLITSVLYLIEVFLFTNALLMWLGFIFDIDLFKSYARSSRFGYDGVFNKVNETSYLYILYVTHLYVKCIINNSKRYFLVFIILTSLLIGTKMVILFLILLTLFHFLIMHKHKNIFRILSLAGGLVFLFFFKPVITFFFDLFPFWDHLQEKYELLTLLFSKRDLLLYNNIDYTQQQWSAINYFIGGPFYNNKFALTQMDGPDLIVFFGILGSALYLFLFLKLYLIRNQKLINIVFLIVFFCGLLGGGFLLSVMAMVYFYLIKAQTENITDLKT